jgi:hypothetical protein
VTQSASQAFQLAYADDMVLFGDDLQAAQANLECKARALARFDLALNADKCKWMIFGERAGAGAKTGAESLTVYGMTIENVGHFKYLGHILTEDCKSGEALKARLAVAGATVGRIRDFLRGREIVLAHKVALYRRLVLSQLLYASETWTPTAQDMDKLERFHSKMCRMITRRYPVKDDEAGTFKYPRTSDLLQITGMETLERIWATQRQAWRDRTRGKTADFPEQCLQGATWARCRNPLADGQHLAKELSQPKTDE